MAADGSLTKYGFPRGYRFVPTPLELLFLLSKVVDRHKLHPPLKSIFQYLPILEYHPKELYERYKNKKEHRYIYFFSRREFQKPGAGAAVPEDKDQKEPRPVRVARGGGWKPSGGGRRGLAFLGAPLAAALAALGRRTLQNVLGDGSGGHALGEPRVLFGGGVWVGASRGGLAAAFLRIAARSYKAQQ